MNASEYLSDVGAAALSSLQEAWENADEDDEIPTTDGVYDPLKEEY